MLENHVQDKQWKEIDGFRGLYAISNHGEIFSTRSNKILKPYRTSNGLKYRSIVLWNGDNRHRYAIHRLVASHFIRPPRPHEQINHKDGNPSNNIVTNLEWVNPTQNALHAYANGLKSVNGEKNSHHVLTEREVSLLRYLRGKYPEIKTSDLAKFYGISNQGIHSILSFKTWNPNALMQMCIARKEEENGKG